MGTCIHYMARVDEYGDVRGQDQELAMMTEIYNRGPISCGISVTDDLLKYTVVENSSLYSGGKPLRRAWNGYSKYR